MSGSLWYQQAVALWRKDLRAELRTRVALGSMGVFALASLMLIALSMLSLKDEVFVDALGHSHLAWDNPAKMALLWVLFCFAAFAGLSHSFVHEESTGTAQNLRLFMSAHAVYAGKLFFNFTVLGAIMLVITPIYMLLTGMQVGGIMVFVPIMVWGGMSLAAVATTVAALASRAHTSGALFGAIGLPMLIVLLVLIMQAAKLCYSAHIDTISIVKDTGGLLSYGILIITLSALSFHFVWED